MTFNEELLSSAEIRNSQLKKILPTKIYIEFIFISLTILMTERVFLVKYVEFFKCAMLLLQKNTNDLFDMKFYQYHFT